MFVYVDSRRICHLPTCLLALHSAHAELHPTLICQSATYIMKKVYTQIPGVKYKGGNGLGIMWVAYLHMNQIFIHYGGWSAPARLTGSKRWKYITTFFFDISTLVLMYVSILCFRVVVVLTIAFISGVILFLNCHQIPENNQNQLCGRPSLNSATSLPRLMHSATSPFNQTDINFKGMSHECIVSFVLSLNNFLE